MAFIKKSGERFQVRQGNNNNFLSSFKTRDKAQKEVKRLHSKNDPKPSNRGNSAKKDFK